MQSDLHRERSDRLGRVAGWLGGILPAAMGLAGGPLFAQHEGHQMPGMSGASGGAGEMPGMASPNPILSWLPWIIGIGVALLAAWGVVQMLRGRRPQWLNRQVAWGTASILVAYVGTAYAVKKLKKPGQMTVVEAQAMDMSVMKAPVGTMPVVTAKAQRGAFEAKVSYTGTVVAFNDEDIYPRVTGWIREMPVYPGDKVEAGQLVARLDTDELGSKVKEAAFARLSAEQMQAQMAAEEAQARAMQAQAEAQQSYARGGVERATKELAAARSVVDETQRNLAAAKAMVRQAEKELAGTRSALQGARSSLDAAREQQSQSEANLANAQAELASVKADLTAAQANVARWRPQLQRSETLYKEGAISLEELQVDQASAQTAEAGVTAAEAKVSRAKSGVSNAEAAVRQAQAMVRVAQAKVDEMQNGVEAAQARLDQARANVDATEAKVARTQAAAEAAQAAVEQTRADLEKSGASVRSTIAGVHVATRRKLGAGASAEQMGAALNTASVIKGYTEIRSSASGVVTQRLVSPGVLVNPGTPILKIAQIDRVRLQAYVSEKDLAGIRVGNPVRVRSMKDPGWITETKVSAIFPAADPTARTVVVEALMPNPGHRFIPGQYITMEIGTNRIDDAVTVPIDAIVEVAPAQTGVFHTEKQRAVWVVQTRKSDPGAKMEYYCTMHPEVVQDHPGNCPKCMMKLEPRTKGGNRYAQQVIVGMGPSGGNRMVVLSGLHGGEEVIVKGNENLREGDSVSPQGAAPDGGAGADAPAMPAAGSHAGMEMPAPGHAGEHGTAMPAAPPQAGQTEVKPAQAPGKTVYTCPMHPEVVSDKPGQCPKCNMRLERKGE